MKITYFKLSSRLIRFWFFEIEIPVVSFRGKRICNTYETYLLVYIAKRIDFLKNPRSMYPSVS